MAQEIDETTLRLQLPSLTLSKHDIRELCNIVVKAANDPESSVVRLIVSRNRESVSTNCIDKLINAKWPQEINAVSLEAFDNENFIRLLMNSHPTGANEVIISSRDSDWVTMRVKEIEDFISEHSNWHWILFNVPLVFFISIVLGAVIGAGIGIGFDLPFEYTLLSGTIGVVVIAYGIRGISEVYPYILIESGRPSAKSRLRKFLNWAIPTVVAGVIGNLIWQTVTRMGS